MPSSDLKNRNDISEEIETTDVTESHTSQNMAHLGKRQQSFCFFI